MSGAEIIALAAVITSGVVGFATVSFNFWNASSERMQRLKERDEDGREWYRRTLFDRRSKALSEEYAWLMKLNRLRGLVPTGKNELMSDLSLNAQAAREWYDLNALYLYDVPPRSSDFVGAVNSASDLSDSSFHKQLEDALQDHRSRAEHVMAAWREGHVG